LYFFPSNRWDILTNDDILIKLPQDNFSMALNLAHKIISNDNLENKKLIDLRVNNHLILK
jgi:cell division septal protein FtsQ